MVAAAYRFLSVCSGIEAFSVAVRDLDFEPAAFSEIEKFPSKLLAYRYPDVPNLGDMTKIDTTKLGRIDWLVGGTPCQSFSVAGLRGGLSDERGNLTLEYVKLARRLQDGNGLRGFLWENVFGVLSDKSNAFGCFLAGIVGADDPLVTPDGARWPSAGMVAGPRARVAWRVLDSRHFGVPQRRRRVYVVADFGDGPDPATVLFEPRGQGRSAAASGETREGIAGTISARTKGGGGLGTDMDLAGGLQVASERVVVNSLTRNNGQRNEVSDMISGHAVVVGALDAHAERAPVLFTGTPSNSNTDYNAREKDFAQALTGDGGNPGARGGDMVVTFNPQGGGTQTTLGMSEDGIGALGASQTPAIAMAMRGREGGATAELGDDQANALRAGNGGASRSMAMTGPQVRRLTPIECERLQGYPNNYTLIPGLSGWRDVGDDENVADLEAIGLTVKVTKKGKRRVNDPDGPRYKALGNSFTTETINWIMCRVQASLRHETMPDWQPMQLWRATP